MRRVAGDEDAAVAVLARHHDAQVPEADVVELDLELEAGRLLQQAVEVEVVRRWCRAGTGAWKKKPSPTSMRPKNCQ